MASGDVASRMSAQLGAWRDELINLTRSNRLLYFKHTQSASVEITAPGMEKLFDHLQKGRAWDFFEPPVDANGRPTTSARNPRASELVTDKATPSQLARSLRAIERRALETFTERGLWTMYVGVGFLHWIDPKDDKPVETPLLLQPVEFGRGSLTEPFRLRATDDDPILNPALVVKLANDLRISLPSLDDFDEVTPRAVADAVENLVRKRSGWSVVDRTVLHPFSFLKEAMYRDLLDHEMEVVDHPLVQVLALGSASPWASKLVFEPVPFEELDDYVSPEDLHHVRDADASQRRCVLAARDGHSFVMDGPPGTGKSQTITNIIAELLFQGKTVLFVSDKAAALEVVHKRLREAKLDEFTLELHSHNATRKAVATELGTALSRRPRTRAQMSDGDRTKLVRVRERLASYAAAINEVRPPLNRSLHDVLGRLAELSPFISAPAPKSITLKLDTAQFATSMEWAEALGRAWGPVERRDTFLWTDVHDTEVGPAVFEGRRRTLEDAMNSIDALETRLGSIDDEIGLGLADNLTNAHRLLDLLTLLEQRREIDPSWLAEPDRALIDRTIAAASVGITDINTVASSLTRAYRDGWRHITSSEATGFQQAIGNLAAHRVVGPVGDEKTVIDLRDSKVFLEQGEQSVAALLPGAERLADAFRVARSALSLSMLGRLARLAQLADPVHRPEAAWFHRSNSGEVSEARRILDGLIVDLKGARTRAEEVFRPSVIELDLKALRARFAELHTGLRKLSGAYRADKKLLAAHVLSGKVDSTVIDRLPDAIMLQSLGERLRQAEEQHANVLGSYYRGDSTEFARIDQALEIAKTALDVAAGDISSDALQRQLSLSSEPNPDMVTVGKSIEQLLAAVAPGIVTSLDDVSVFDGVELCRHGARALGDAATAMDAIDARLASKLSVGAMRRTLHDIARHEHLCGWLTEHEPEFVRVLGPQYAGLTTSRSTVAAAADWARQINEAVGRTPTAEQARALLSTSFTADDLRPLLDRLEGLLDESLQPFTSERTALLRDEMSVSFADATRVLASLYSSVGEAEEWLRFDEARKQLTEAGLGDVADFCIKRDVNRDSVAPIHERAILERWTDLALIEDSERLSPLAAADRDGLVEDFRRLDDLLATDSAGTVLNACSTRRPTTIIGETQIIKREAEKQRRHMPIRTLFDLAGNAAQALKPCFMMSPLSVSQYLPSHLEFDVVIFDEASQVRPADAINCLYRGSQAIVAGDQRQLPPTSFFQLESTDTSDSYDEDELDEFQSVLDLAKASAAIQSLPLTWHYRSEHEALITYSNQRFYDTMLTTFPSALQEADDIGVEFFKVDGVYGRGTTGTNPIEARKIVERVLHHRRHHPHLSLGVIAFSSKQQLEIESAIEEASVHHPDLLSVLSDDRLDGFFVKNLENVQGDERDIILFSIGYGPDDDGKMTANFGPLIKAGGWRRLNVAITRARRRVEVVASFLPNALAASSSNEGISHLLGYLEFARTGTLASTPVDQDDTSSSKVADVIASTLSGWGYEVDRNVGAGTLRIDIGVRHPSRPGQYLLGIQCDGESYGTAAVTRDRDRLTHQVLSNLGWTLHRIWSTAWFRDRGTEEARLRAAINAALSGRSNNDQRRRVGRPGPTIRIEHEDVDHTVPEWATPYTPWIGKSIQGALPPHSPDARTQLRSLVDDIVSVEGPISFDRIVKIVRAAWLYGSGGKKTSDAVIAVTRASIGGQLIESEPGFVSKRDQPVVVRVPVDDDNRTRRTVSEVSWAELHLAVMEVVRSASTVNESDLITYIARLFGWNRSGAQIRSSVSEAVKSLVRQGRLVRNPDTTISFDD